MFSVGHLDEAKLWLVFRGVLAVIGGFLVHLSLGTIYTFGNMAPYIVSYIRNQSHPENLKQETTTWIFAFALAGQGISMFIGGWMVKKIGPRWTTLIGGWVMSLGVALSYLTVKLSFYAVMFTYGFVFGVGVGIAYIGPLSTAMNWMPKWKGFANGIVVAGFGLGALIFNAVQTTFVNPANVKIAPNADGDKYFEDAQLLSRVPKLFLLLGGIYAGMQLIGSLMLTNPPKDYGKTAESDLVEEQEKVYRSGQYKEVEDNPYKTEDKGIHYRSSVVSTSGSVNTKSFSRQSDSDNSPHMRTPVENLLSSSDDSITGETSHLLQNNHGPIDGRGDYRDSSASLSPSVIPWSSKNVVASLKPQQMLKKMSFYLLWYMFLANGMSIVFIATLYKFFGQTFTTTDDHYLAYVGSVSAIFNCSGRIVWGLLADKVSYKFAFVVLSGVMTIFTLTLYACSAVGKGMFFIWICVIFFCIGGNFSLFPTAIGRAFGLQYVSINYGLLFTSQIVAGSVGALLSTVLKSHIGYDGLFFLVSAFSCSAFILALLYKPKRYIALQPKPV